MKHWYGPAALALALAAGGASEAGSLEELWQTARERSPELAALRHAVEAAEGRSLGARLHPNPSLELEAEEVALARPRLSHSQNTVGLAQELDFGARRTRRIAAAFAEEDVARAAMARRERELFSEIAEVFSEILYLAEADRLAASALVELAEPLAVVRERVRLRAAPQWELERSELEAQRLELEAARLAPQARAAAASLSRLCGTPITADELVGSLPNRTSQLDEPAYRRRVLASHPRLLLAQAEEAAARRRLAQAEAERRAPPQVRLALGRNTALDENILEAGIALPLPLWNRNQGAIAEAQARLRQAESESAAELDRLREEIERALAEYASAATQLARLGDALLPRAERVLELTESGYRVGKQSFLEWLEARQALLEARQDELSTRREAARAAARLHALAGVSLDNFYLGGREP